ncbi:response regulator transcription factor [Bacillus sp. DJP31]|uniref:response regulator transcription factor n=1 Tax=Bacillus sp. DJP31 TaxID=3409789 RepID=UPI003BB6900D
MKRVLIVDDEQRMLDLIALQLSEYHFECQRAHSGEEALILLEKEMVDIVLLDVMMPGMDGWTTCRAIREFSSVPIIMLTARDQKNDIVRGLQLGADDYMTKPFDEKELLARIEAVLRRVKSQSKVVFKELVWNEDSMQVSYKGKGILLTPKEFILLGTLLQNINKVYTREDLIETVWGFDAETEGRTIDSHVKNIREKLRKVGFPIEHHLQTVWGVGYKWVSEE